MTTLRIGAGTGFSGDRMEPAIDLVSRGELDFLVLECLAERTIALAQLRKQSVTQPGYDLLLELRLRDLLPLCRAKNVRLISNMGAADPRSAAEKTLEIARELGLKGLRIAWVEGDDVMPKLDSLVPIEADPLPETYRAISANAYLGCESIVEALANDADVVITGRVADPSLFLAPMVHAFHWRMDDWELLGRGTAVGHLLECAGQLTGGYFADPGYKDVPGLEDLGFPLGEVHEDGSVLLTKLEGTGGTLTLQTCREQLLYEVLDPAAYVTPDVISDFTHVRLHQQGKDAVRMDGAGGRRRPSMYKVSVGVRNGFFGEGQISYAGSGAVARAKLAETILTRRLAHSCAAELRFDLIGMNSLHGESSRMECEPYEVRLRCVGRFDNLAATETLLREVESLYVNGPAGGGGITTSLRESIAIYPALLPRDAVTQTMHMEVA
jgi:hypothetical protein